MVLKEERVFKMNIFGDHYYQCYSIYGHRYDAFGYCTVCHNPSMEAYIRGKHLLEEIERKEKNDRHGNIKKTSAGK